MRILAYPVVHVIWVDSHRTIGWEHSEEFEIPDTIIESVGILIYKDKENISITSSVSALGSLLDALTIPRRAVKELKYL